MKLAIEKAIEEAAPEVMRIEVEGDEFVRIRRIIRKRSCSEEQAHGRRRSRDQLGTMDRARQAA